MKLYYSNGACSLASHIVLEELGLPYEAIRVDFQKPSPDFEKLNPMHAVPVVVMDNGQPLTEGSAILQYLADQKPEAGLAPKAGTLERYRLQEWLNFIASEVHKSFGPLFGLDYISQNPTTREEVRAFTLKDLERKFDVLVQKLGSNTFLMPSGYSVADAYLFTILGWTQYHKIDLSRWPTLVSYMNRVRERPAVMKALKEEHLLK